MQGNGGDYYISHTVVKSEVEYRNIQAHCGILIPANFLSKNWGCNSNSFSQGNSFSLRTSRLRAYFFKRKNRAKNKRFPEDIINGNNLFEKIGVMSPFSMKIALINVQVNKISAKTQTNIANPSLFCLFIVHHLLVNEL